MCNICNFTIGFIVLAALAFVLAALEALFNFSILGIGPTSFSRACNNLALIAIALAVCCKKEPTES
jgi:hypothetical protein